MRKILYHAAIPFDVWKLCTIYIRYWLLVKGYSTLGVRYRDLQARVCKQETRNLTLHEAQPSEVLNFEFLVCKRMLQTFLIFSLSKPLK